MNEMKQDKKLIRKIILYLLTIIEILSGIICSYTILLFSKFNFINISSLFIYLISLILILWITHSKHPK